MCKNLPQIWQKLPLIKKNSSLQEYSSCWLEFFNHTLMLRTEGVIIIAEASPMDKMPQIKKQ